MKYNFISIKGCLFVIMISTFLSCTEEVKQKRETSEKQLDSRNKNLKDTLEDTLNALSNQVRNYQDEPLTIVSLMDSSLLDNDTLTVRDLVEIKQTIYGALDKSMRMRTRFENLNSNVTKYSKKEICDHTDNRWFLFFDNNGEVSSGIMNENEISCKQLITMREKELNDIEYESLLLLGEQKITFEKIVELMKEIENVIYLLKIRMISSQKEPSPSEISAISYKFMLHLKEFIDSYNS